MAEETKENKKEEKKVIQPTNNQGYNEIVLGSIRLSSSDQSIQVLGGLAIELLRFPEVKDYLDVIKTKEKLNGASYVD